jgi:hypothetical protein
MTDTSDRLPGTCELVTARGGIPCPQPAVTRLTGTCPCGHVTERGVCEGHRTPGKPLWCRACYRLPEGATHKCPVDLIPAGAVARAVTPGQENAHQCGRHCGPGYHPDAVTVRLIEQHEEGQRAGRVRREAAQAAGTEK